MQHVKLCGLSNAKHACLREVTGFEEQSVGDTATATAIQFLDQLLCRQGDNVLSPGKTDELTTLDREILLSSVYEQLYGPRIESNIVCSNCDSEFEVSFSLKEALTSAFPDEALQDRYECDTTGAFKIDNKGRFRLPNGSDELRIQGLPSEEAEEILLANCLVEGDFSALGEEVREAIQRLAPVPDLDIDAVCPECQHSQSAHFVLQSYFLTSLVQERPRLLNEIHLLATTYGWSLNEILSLPRNQRRAFVELIASGADNMQGSLS